MIGRHAGEGTGQMAGRQRGVRGRARRIATLSVVAATATAMTVGVARPLDDPHAAVVNANVDLAGATNLLPNRDQAPGIIGGLGATTHSGNPAIADQLARAVLNGISVTAFAQ